MAFYRDILPSRSPAGPVFAIFQSPMPVTLGQRPHGYERSIRMKIGVPKEIKIHEYRVGLVPAGVRELVDSGHQVLVQSGAGAGIGFEDAHYQSAGAKVVQRAQDVFAAADLVVKVKEPQLAECK